MDPDNKSLKLSYSRGVVMGSSVFRYNEFHTK